MLKQVWQILREAAKQFIEDEAITRAAAVSFFTALSFGPLLILLIWLSSFLGESLVEQLIEEVRNLVGPQAGEMVRIVVDNAENHPGAGSIAGIISIAALVFAATTVFAQLQRAVNAMFDVMPKPGRSITTWLRVRGLALATILAIGFLLLVSLFISSAIAMLLPTGGIWSVVDIVASLIVFTLLFAALFKMLPDVELPWRDMWIGALVTAVLFAAGKIAIGQYLGISSVGSAYGAAGALVVLLVWVYYSSLIFFFGAEITQQVALQHGSSLHPSPHARWASEPDALKKQNQQQQTTN